MRLAGWSVFTVSVILAIALFAACGGEPSRETDAGTRPAQPRLTGFFEPGNFAVMTIPVPSGPPEILSMKQLSVRVEMIGRFARTEVTQVFHNHTNRRTEGTYEFTLPDGAAISRLAMDVDGKMMEGELVERARARQIYEDIVRKQKDPALLEWQSGNRFKTQIFPIPANGDKKVILAYEQILPISMGEFTYRYMLPRITGETAGGFIEKFEFSLDASGATIEAVEGYAAEIKKMGDSGKASIRQSKFNPSGPLDVRLRVKEQDEAVVHYAQFKDEKFFIMDFMPQLPARPATAASSMVLVIDSSASTGRVELERIKKAAVGLIGGLAGGSYNIVYGDYGQDACFEKPRGAPDPAPAQACLDRIDAGGGTNLDALLAKAVEAAAAFEGPVAMVLFSDGSVSLGEMDGDLIKAHLAKAIAGREVTLSTVAIGHTPDFDFMRALAHTGRGHAFSMSPGDKVDEIVKRVAARAGEPVFSDVSAKAVQSNIEGLVPARPVNIGRGEALAVMGRLDEGKARVEIRGKYLGSEVVKTYDLSAPERPGKRTLVDFWARAVIDEMQGKGVRRDKVVLTSLQYGVMSKYTSFLVLESEEQYKEYRVGRLRESEKIEREQSLKTVLKKSGESLQSLLAKGDDGTAARGVPLPPPVATSRDLAKMPSKMAESTGEGAVHEKPAKAEPSEPTGDLAALVADQQRALADRMRAEKMEEGKAESAHDDRAAKKEEKKAEPSGERRPKFGAPKKAKGGWGPGGVGDYGVSAKEPAPDTRRSSIQIRPADRRPQPNIDWEMQVIADLEARKSRLSMDERIELIERYLRKGFKAKAEAWAREAGASFKKIGSAEASMYLFKAATVTAAPEAVKAAGVLLKAWMAAHPSLEDQYQMLTSEPRLAQLFPERLYDAACARVKKGEKGVGVVDTCTATAAALKRESSVAAQVLALCTDADEDSDQYLEWLGRLSADKDVQQRLRVLLQKPLKAIKKTREQDVANPVYIVQHAAMLMRSGDEAGGYRVLSEIVEFEPQSKAARVKYGRELIRLKRTGEGCAQLTVVAQLDPSERDIFKEMMSLRRGNDEIANTIKGCIVDGVSRLPVQRAISIVLTWEDPEADVDLHVTEAEGEEVFYQHRESRAGGFLYYDITNGFGPEIYTLGAGPKGGYRVGVAYFGGQRPEVSGTVTILRDAGTPRESREERKFTLRRTEMRKTMPLGEIRL